MTEAKEPTQQQRELAERLKTARTKRGLTQAELAERANLSKAYPAHLENCLIRSPGAAQLRALAQELEVPFEWLAFNTGSSPFEEAS